MSEEHVGEVDPQIVRLRFETDQPSQYDAEFVQVTDLESLKFIARWLSDRFDQFLPDTALIRRLEFVEPEVVKRGLVIPIETDQRPHLLRPGQWVRFEPDCGYTGVHEELPMEDGVTRLEPGPDGKYQPVPPTEVTIEGRLGTTATFYYNPPQTSRISLALETRGSARNQRVVFDADLKEFLGALGRILGDSDAVAAAMQ